MNMLTNEYFVKRIAKAVTPAEYTERCLALLQFQTTRYSQSVKKFWLGVIDGDIKKVEDSVALSIETIAGV